MSTINLRREQFDRLVTNPVDLRHFQQPKSGWIRSVREALGMSARQLGERVGVSQPSIAKMEKSEAAGTITLDSLRKTANGMGCHLVYAFVPNDSLESLIHDRAVEVASAIVSRVEHTMALEDQQSDYALIQKRVNNLADSLLLNFKRDLWDNDMQAPKKVPNEI